ncbi:MAG: dCTP deaminase [Candidatus Paceibacterales bacterium]
MEIGIWEFASMLSDRDLKKVIKAGEVTFSPKLKPDQIGPASIDLHLAPNFKFFRIDKFSLMDTKKPLPKDFMATKTLKAGEAFILHPSDFILASTKEYVKLSDKYAMRVEGKSSLARMGVLVHTAGFVDPGFEGTITLEISNQANVPVALYPDMYICQVAVEELSSPSEVPYNKRKKSLYNRQSDTTEVRTSNLFSK